MGIKGKAPETGSRGVTYLFDKCSDGRERRGWISGDVHVLTCHVGRGRTKPCERILLGTNAPCPGCEERRAVEEVGYVPLRREDGRPVCVLIRKTTIAFVAKFKRGSSVVWGREPERFESVYVRPALKEQRWEHYFDYGPNDDMGYWLPLFFSTPHLAAAMRDYFGANQCQSVVTEPLPAPVEPVTEAARASTAKPRDDGGKEADGAFAEVVKRLRQRAGGVVPEASSNGSKKRK